MIGIVADNFYRQVMFLRRLFQAVYLLRINPRVAFGGDEERRHFQFRQNIFFRDVAIEGRRRLQLRQLAGSAPSEGSTHTITVDRESIYSVSLFGGIDRL